METILVTGGAGFIGSNFVRLALEKTSAQFVVIDKLTYAGSLLNLQDLLPHPRVVFVQADIANRPLMEQVFRDHHPTACLNFAAETHVDRSIDDPSPFITTNVVGTSVLLEASRKYLVRASPSLREQFRFLHVSTDEVYGSLGATGKFSESTAYAPNSPYSASKAGSDHLVRAYFETYELPTLLTNCSNNYGPYQFPEKLIPLTLLNAMEGKTLPIYGDGLNVRDWLFVEDHCMGLLRVLRKGEVGESYNIGGNSERTNIEIVDRICQSLEQLLPASRSPILQENHVAEYGELKSFVPDRLGHDRRYAIDATKIQRELGWVPCVGFDQGLDRTIRWYLHHQDWLRAILEEKGQVLKIGPVLSGANT